MYGEWKRFKGQAQKWFLLEFQGSEAEVNLEVDHQEFDAWRWEALEAMPDLVVDFKRGVYQEVVREFAPQIKQLQGDLVSGA